MIICEETDRQSEPSGEEWGDVTAGLQIACLTVIWKIARSQIVAMSDGDGNTMKVAVSWADTPVAFDQDFRQRGDDLALVHMKALRGNGENSHHYGDNLSWLAICPAGLPGIEIHLQKSQIQTLNV